MIRFIEKQPWHLNSKKVLSYVVFKSIDNLQIMTNLSELFLLGGTSLLEHNFLLQHRDQFQTAT